MYIGQKSPRCFVLSGEGEEMEKERKLEGVEEDGGGAGLLAPLTGWVGCLLRGCSLTPSPPFHSSSSPTLRPLPLCRELTGLGKQESGDQGGPGQRSMLEWLILNGNTSGMFSRNVWGPGWGALLQNH